MYFIKKFDTHSEYENYITGEETGKIYFPNTSLCINENDIHYNDFPYDYKVEYLKSTNAQWIDTGISTKDSFVGIGITIKFEQYVHDKWGAGYNNYSGGSRGGFQIGMYSNKISFTYYKDNTKVYGLTIDYDNSWHKATMNCLGTGIILDGTERETNQVQNLGQYGGNVFLFARGGNVSTNYRAATTIKHAAIYVDNDTIVRNFIPVVDFNGVGCMYDTVSGQLFYNQGTGEFIVGPKI